MPPVSRKTDTGSNHGAWVPSKAIAGSGNVFIEGKPALRKGDAVAPHVKPKSSPHPRKVSGGSPTVYVNGRPAARINDAINCGGKMAQGAQSVYADELGRSTKKMVSGVRSKDSTSSANLKTISAEDWENMPEAQVSEESFASPDEAAKAALDTYNPKSIEDNREYGGSILKDQDGRYRYTLPASSGSEMSVDNWNLKFPEGMEPVGDFHTHGDYSIFSPDGDIVRVPGGVADRASLDELSSDFFSERDLSAYELELEYGDYSDGYVGYLGTPSGRYYKYDPATNTSSEF